MPAQSELASESKLTLGQRLLLVLPNVRGGQKDGKTKEPVGDWMRSTFMKPEDPAKPKRQNAAPLPVDELEATIKRADDKERAIGLVAGPVGAAIGFLVVHTLIANDPPQYLTGGVLDKLYVNPSSYDEALVAFLGLALLIVVFSLLRKRMLIGLATALYGVSILQFHYWGFAIPFALCGAWYLVRAYRLHRDLKLITGDLPAGARARANRSVQTPGANKRYTPKASSAVRPRRAS